MTIESAGGGCCPDEAPKRYVDGAAVLHPVRRQTGLIARIKRIITGNRKHGGFAS